MDRLIALPHISAGFVSVLVGYTSAAALVYQAALASGGGTEMASSWLWAVGVGMGVGSTFLSLRFKQPIVIAWSTPGAALLITSLPGTTASNAVGAFLFSSALITICGITGLFNRIARLIPIALANALLAGILVRFAFQIFPSFTQQVEIIGLMLIAYFLGKWRKSIYAIPITLAVGIMVSILMNQTQSVDWNFTPALPLLTSPTFDVSVLIGIGLPLFIVTMASQNIPGIATLRAHEYDAPASPLISVSGMIGLALAPFGGYAFNLAAITAALCMGEDVDHDKRQRYKAAIWCGLFFMVAGIFAGMVTSLFEALPIELVATIAGLALLGTISNGLNLAMSESGAREPAILTFAITASNGSFLSIGAPFWGLLVGMTAYYLLTKKI